MIYLDEPDLDYVPSTRGEDVRTFERAMAEYLGVDDCVAVNSGTSALHLALLACGIGRGDTVVVPACTFVATANAVLYTGAKVRISDIDSKDWHLLRGTHKKLDAVIGVSLYGNPKSNFRSTEPSIPVIGDYAEAIHLKPPVNTHKYTCYSFNGNKTITTGSGGLIVGFHLGKIRDLINPAHTNGLAYNYGMAAENARLGLRQLEHLDDYIELKKEFNRMYREELPFLKFQGNEPGPYWMTAAAFPEWVNIKQLKFRLEIRGIRTRRIFKPLNYYKHLRWKRWWPVTNWFKRGPPYPNAEYLYQHGLVLPSSVKNKYDQIYSVCKTIKKLI